MLTGISIKLSLMSLQFVLAYNISALLYMGPGRNACKCELRTNVLIPGISHSIQVLSVREVVPGRSNNEIILVLTYYDYSVEDAIQAYLEGK